MAGRKQTMTKRQIEFADLVLEGEHCNTECYRMVYDTKARAQVCAVKAYQLLQRPLVKAYIAEAREAMKKTKFLTRERKREILDEIADTNNSKAADRIKAIEVDNRMTGDDAPQKVEVFGLTDLMKLVRSGDRGSE